jgi:hypothetical protein
MPKITMVFGLLLCALTVAILILTGGDFSSMTIFIPTFVGVPLFFLGLFGVLRPDLRMHLMHGAAALGLLGALAALGRGIPQLFKIARGEVVEWLPVSMVWGMILICITYVLVCVESFVSARKARLAAGTQSTDSKVH